MAGKSYKLEQGNGKLRDVLDNAFNDIGDLASQLGDWADNMENGNLGATDKCTQIREAADTLADNSDAPDIPSVDTKKGEIDLGELDVTYLISTQRSKRRGPSRQVQLENACSMMDACMAALDEHLGEHEDDDNAETLRDDIERKKDEVEAIEIPGMYG